MMVRVHEPIRVAVVFGPGRSIRPVWFDWHNRKHDVLETTYSWTDIKGNARRLHFAVRDESNIYELTYDTLEHTWELSGVGAD